MWYVTEHIVRTDSDVRTYVCTIMLCQSQLHVLRYRYESLQDSPRAFTFQVRSAGRCRKVSQHSAGEDARGACGGGGLQKTRPQTIRG